MKYPMGKRMLEMGSRYLTEFRDSKDILSDTEALRERLREDGYLFIRQFHDRNEVLEARKEFLKQLQTMGRLHPNAPIDEARIGDENKSRLQ
jgi:hypothetical protein